MRLWVVGFVTLAYLMISCSGNTSYYLRKNLKLSTVQHVVCTSDTSQSYQVYLPSAFVRERKWPVMFMFDPHGSGQLAIDHAKAAAERYNYILIASNNSRNNASNIDHIIQALFTDVYSRFPVNDKRVYAAGFSGGGRVASSIALSTGKMRGIITCSAGMPELNPLSVSRKFEIFAIAGKEDFNYDEVMSLSSQLAGASWLFMIEAFDGGHNWPPAKYFNDALLWFELNGMRDGSIPTDKKLVNVMYDSSVTRYKDLLHKKMYIQAEAEGRKGITFFDQLHNTRRLQKEVENIQSLDGYHAEKQKESEVKDMERQLSDGYLQRFTQGDHEWWKRETDNLKEKLKTEKDSMTRQMFSRVKGFLGIVCYSYTSKAIATKDLNMAAKCTDIYGMLEPENTDYLYYKALLYDFRNQSDSALIMLKRAKEYGFSDTVKIREQFSKKTFLMLKGSFK